MATAVSPIKVDAETDRLLSESAHFLERSKKDVVDVAVRDNVDAHRDEINEGIRAALGRLDGSNASVVSLISGVSRDELGNLGGVPEA